MHQSCIRDTAVISCFILSLFGALTLEACQYRVTLAYAGASAWAAQANALIEKAVVVMQQCTCLYAKILFTLTKGLLKFQSSLVLMTDV